MRYLVIILGCLFFIALGNRPFSSPDEGRYVEIAREMATTGDFITPHLNTLKYFEKPPLFYWIQALAVQKLGLGEYVMRLPVALFAFLGCLVTYFFGARLFTKKTGLYAAFILGSSLLYFSLSRIIILDMALTFWVTLSLFSFIHAVENNNKRRLYMLISYASIACAVLTKGIVSIILFGLPSLLWVSLYKKWSALRPLYIFSGITVFLLIAAPWHIMVMDRNPEFFDFYIIHEHFERYLTTIHRRHQPIWFFIPCLVLGFFPWTSFLPSLFGQLRRLYTHPVIGFLCLWVTAIAVFFSLSSSKLIPYILPVFPALSLLTAHYITTHLTKKDMRIMGGFFILLTIASFAARPFAPLHHYSNLSIYLWLLTILCFLSALICFFWQQRRHALRLTVGIYLLILSILVAASPYVNKISVKPFVQWINTHMPDRIPVISYHTYYQDLPVYLNRPVTIVEWHGELDFGAKHTPYQRAIITEKDFLDLWYQHTHICLITRSSFLQGLPKDFSGHIVKSINGHHLLCRSPVNNQ